MSTKTKKMVSLLLLFTIFFQILVFNTNYSSAESDLAFNYENITTLDKEALEMKELETEEPEMEEPEMEEPEMEEPEMEEPEMEDIIIFSTNFDNARLALSTIEDRILFWTGEEAVVYVDLDLSSLDESINSPSLEIFIPSEFITSVRASDLESQASKTVINTEGNYNIKYTFERLTGGTTLRAPITITSSSGMTPNGATLPVVTKLYDDQGTLIKEAEIELRYRVHIPVLTKYTFVGNSLSQFDGRVLFGGVADPDDSSKISQDGATYIGFRYAFNRNSMEEAPGSTTIGRRTYQGYTITDYLPEGAVFDQEQNVGWVYDPDSRQVSYTVQSSITAGHGTSWLSPILRLRFPGQRVNENIVNRASVQAIPSSKEEFESILESSDDITFRLSTGIQGFFVSKSRANNINIIDHKSYKEREYGYHLSINNSRMERPLENIEMRDFNLDSRFVFTRVEIPRNSGNFSGNLSLYGVQEDNQEVLISSSFDLNSDFSEYIPSGIKELVLRSEEGAFLPHNNFLQMRVFVKLKNPDEVHFNEMNSSANFLYNSMRVSGNYVGINQIVSAQHQNIPYRLVKYDPGFLIGKRRLNSAQNVFIGDSVSYEIQGIVTSQNAILPGDQLMNPIIVDLLPEGMDYINGSTTISYYSALSNQKDYINSTPEVVFNYKDTGRTALIWSFNKNFEGYNYNTQSSQNSVFLINYQTRVTKYNQEGANQNTAYMAWDNMNEIRALNGTKDIYDINNNKDTDELVATSNASINYIPPREVIITKRVKGSLDNSHILTPARGLSEIGSVGSYQLEIYNNSIRDLNTLGIIDILPYVGDKALVANDAGYYQNRNSEFPVKLSGAVQAPLGYKIYYATQNIGNKSTIDYYSDTSIWSDSITEYDQVAAIKVVMQEGTILREKERITLTLPFEVSFDESLGMEKIANNSFAATVNNALFFESNFSALELVKYKVDGYVFNDEFKTGQVDESDPRFEDYIVELVDEEENPVLDKNGKAYIAKTDQNGYYEMQVFENGNYKIKVKTPDGYEITTTSTDEMLSNHIIDQQEETTNAFSLNSQRLRIRKNAGYFPVNNNIQIEKTADKEKIIVGEEITYTFTVTNIGNTTLNKVNILDQLEGLSDIEYLTINDKNITDSHNITLMPRQVLIAKARYIVKQEDIDKGKLINKAVVKAITQQGEEVKTQDSLTIPAEEMLDPVNPEPVQPVNPEPVQPVNPEPVQPVNPEPVQPVNPEPVEPVNPEPVKPVSPIPSKIVKTIVTEENNQIGGEIELPDEAVPAVVFPPLNGTVEIDGNGKWTYTPKTGFIGRDTFTIRVIGPYGYEEIVEIDVDVVPVGSATPQDGEEIDLGTPTGVPMLPKTDGVSPIFFYIFALILILTGLSIRNEKLD